MQTKYDIFIAYSHHDIGKEYAVRLYRYLTSTTPLRVFFDTRGNLSTNDTTEALRQSDTVVLLLTSQTLSILKGELAKKEDQRSMLIRELETMNGFESDRIIPLNIVEGKKYSGKEIRFVRKDLDDETYDEVKKRFGFLTSINYIKSNYTNNRFRFNINDIIERLPVKQKEIIALHIKINRKRVRTNTILLGAVLIATVFSTILFASKLYKNENEERMLLIGGGTAREYLLTHDINPETMPNTIMVHAPSTLVWPLLAEVNKDSSADSYYTVILSSQDINTDSILHIFDSSDIDQLKYDYHLVDLPLEPVHLQVGLYPKNMFDKYDDTINVSDLNSLIKKNGALLVSTSPKSGTLNAYRKFLKNDSLCGKSIRPGRDNLLHDYKKNYDASYIVVLQNELYRIKNNEVSEIKPLYLVNDTGYCKLVIHLYTMVKCNHDGDHNRSSLKIEGKLGKVLTGLGWDGNDSTYNAQSPKSIIIDTLNRDKSNNQ